MNVSCRQMASLHHNAFDEAAWADFAALVNVMASSSDYTPSDQVLYGVLEGVNARFEDLMEAVRERKTELMREQLVAAVQFDELAAFLATRKTMYWPPEEEIMAVTRDAGKTMSELPTAVRSQLDAREDDESWLESEACQDDRMAELERWES